MSTPFSTVPLGLILIGIGSLCMDMGARWYGVFVMALGFLFLLAHLLAKP